MKSNIGGATTNRSFAVGSWLFFGAKNNKGDYTGGWGRQWAGKGWGKMKSSAGKMFFGLKESIKDIKSRMASLRNKE